MRMEPYFTFRDRLLWLKASSTSRRKPTGGLITIEIEGDNLGDWLEAATWHSGRENIPRRIGDEFSMLRMVMLQPGMMASAISLSGPSHSTSSGPSHHCVYRVRVVASPCWK